MDSNCSSIPEGITGSAEGIIAIARTAKSTSELPGGEAKACSVIVAAPSLGPECGATKSLEVSSQRLVDSGISEQAKPKARQKSSRIENPLRESISLRVPSQQQPD